MRTVLRGAARRHASAAAAPPWRLSAGEPGYVEGAAQSILEHGFVVLEGMLSPQSLSALKGPLLDRTDAIFDRLSSKRVELEVGSARGFHEVVLRSPGRWDLPCEAEIVPLAVREACERRVQHVRREWAWNGARDTSRKCTHHEHDACEEDDHQTEA